MPIIDDRPGAASEASFLEDFDGRKDRFSDLCSTTKSLIERILTEKGIVFHSVQARVKSRSKLKLKYCNPEKDYLCLDNIPDVVGLRVITYYSDAIDNVQNIIRQEFNILGPPDDKRVAAANDFGYSAVHLDCSYSNSSLERTEYRRFANYRFEIQITTILGHAWAEMYHPWYDNRSGANVEDVRGFHRLAAVLELADKEFVNIRTSKEKRDSLEIIREDAHLPDSSIPKS